MINHLQEPADVRLIMGAHENHVLEQPEEGAVVVLLWLQYVQYAVILEEESSSALCRET